MRVRELAERLEAEAASEEAILATNPSVQGATALLITRLSKKTRGSRSPGSPSACPWVSDLRYTDKMTLAKAMEYRRGMWTGPVTKKWALHLDAPRFFCGRSFPDQVHSQPGQHDGEDDPQRPLRQVIGRNSPQEGPEDDPGGQARQDPGDHVPVAPVGVGTDGRRRNHAQKRTPLRDVLVHPDKEDHPCDQEGPAADAQQPRDETRREAGGRKWRQPRPARQGR
ncbi:MAG: hypothetical protein MZW92_17180 [Comamonadaceae bacterium]|nr:hypothetical protein [Comamonadaceae bacterium]